MKKWGIFTIGLITGVILTISFLLIIANRNNDHEDGLISYSEHPVEFNVSDKFEVFQVLNNGALANCQDNDRSLGIYTGPIVYLPFNNNLYYDDQIITVPEGYKAMQIGTFRYNTQAAGQRVVPIIVFDK